MKNVIILTLFILVGGSVYGQKTMEPQEGANYDKKGGGTSDYLATEWGLTATPGSYEFIDPITNRWIHVDVSAFKQVLETFHADQCAKRNEGHNYAKKGNISWYYMDDPKKVRRDATCNNIIIKYERLFILPTPGTDDDALAADFSFPAGDDVEDFGNGYTGDSDAADNNGDVEDDVENEGDADKVKVPVTETTKLRFSDKNPHFWKWVVGGIVVAGLATLVALKLINKPKPATGEPIGDPHHTTDTDAGDDEPVGDPNHTGG